MRIELSGVSKRFGRVCALDDVNLDIASGRRVALIGPNGSGKSTLTRALMGLVRVTGRVRLAGLSPDKNRLALARRLAYVPQIAPQLDAPVGDLLQTVADVRGLDEQAFSEVADELGLDLEAIDDRPFRALSGGMKQKLLISLALAVQAELFVLDEPTASLDARARERFFALFARRARDATLILCSHRLEEIRHLVDHVVALDEGRVSYDGPAAEYLARSALCVLEVHVENGQYSDWLAARGFTPRAGGWWANTVPHDQKVALLGTVSSHLGEKLENVLVRDLEALDVENGGHAKASEEGPSG